MRKHKLLREDILPAMASNRKVQRLLNEFMDLLSEYESSEANQDRKNESAEANLDKKNPTLPTSSVTVSDQRDSELPAKDSALPGTDQMDSAPAVIDHMDSSPAATDQKGLTKQTNDQANCAPPTIGQDNSDPPATGQVNQIRQ